MSTDTTITEAAVVADLAEKAIHPTTVYADSDRLLARVTDDGFGITDLEQYADRPARHRGTFQVHDAVSFVTAVTELDTVGKSRIYANAKTATVVAVLNDHEPEHPGWGDLVVSLTLERTREWSAWRALDGNLVSQLEFATHIEENLATVAEPPAADLLEICQNLEGSMSATFRSGARLRDGSRQFQWSETIDVGGGANGELVIPSEIVLTVRLFEGSDPIQVTARLRHRIREGKLALGYVIPDAADLERSVFDDTVDGLVSGRNALTLPVIRGQLPTSRR